MPYPPGRPAIKKRRQRIRGPIRLCDLRAYIGDRVIKRIGDKIRNVEGRLDFGKDIRSSRSCQRQERADAESAFEEGQTTEAKLAGVRFHSSWQQGVANNMTVSPT